MGKAGRRITCSAPGEGCGSYFGAEANRTEVWARELADGGIAVALLNRGTNTTRISVSWHQLGITNGSTTCSVRDLWAQHEMGLFQSSVGMAVASHDTAVVKITACHQ